MKRRPGRRGGARPLACGGVRSLRPTPSGLLVLGPSGTLEEPRPTGRVPCAYLPCGKSSPEANSPPWRPASRLVWRITAGASQAPIRCSNALSRVPSPLLHSHSRHLPHSHLPSDSLAPLRVRLPLEHTPTPRGTGSGRPFRQAVASSEIGSPSDSLPTSLTPCALIE